MTLPKIGNKSQVPLSYISTAAKKTADNKSASIFLTYNAKNCANSQNRLSTKIQQNVKPDNSKTDNFNKILESRINSVTANLQKVEKENGLIGKAWSWTKNKIGFGDSSNKVREIQANEKKLLAQFNSDEKARTKAFKELTGFEYNNENLEKFIKGQIKLKSEIAIEKYKEGQEMAVDITSDIVSGIMAYGTAAACIAGGIAAAPFTAGASLGAVAVGVGIAAGAGAATKVAIKGGEAAVGGKKYSLKQAGKDATIGAVSGALAPVTVGAGGAVANSVGKTAPKFIATSARLSVEGATFGGVDGGVRSALEGDSLGKIGLNTLKGAGVGALAGNILGHGGNALKKLYNQNCKLNIINGLRTKLNHTVPKTIKHKTLAKAGNLNPKDIIPTIQDANITSYRFRDSKLLDDFTPLLSDITKQSGISTQNGIGGCFVKGTSKTPLGTSGVGNCAVICMQNSKTKTHALYHAFPVQRDAVSYMQKEMNIIMPEGFDKVFIIPGRDPETANTSINLLKAARRINKEAQVEFRHSANGDNVQIILYDGNVYGLPFSHEGSVFKVLDALEYPENYYIGMTK